MKNYFKVPLNGPGGLVKYIFVFSFVFSMNTYAADWISVGVDRVGDVAYEQSRIVILDPSYYETLNKVIRVPILYNYNQPQNYYFKTHAYMSTVNITLFDCRTGFARAERMVISSQKYDSGDKLADYEYSEKDEPWGKPGPLTGKVFSRIKYLCN